MELTSVLNIAPEGLTGGSGTTCDWAWFPELPPSGTSCALSGLGHQRWDKGYYPVIVANGALVTNKT